MMEPIRRVGFGLITLICIASYAGQTAAAEAGSTPTQERFEVSAIKGVRPFLVDMLTAIQQGDVPRAKGVFEAYDAAWNGSEVYIITRSRALYQVLQLDL